MALYRPPIEFKFEFIDDCYLLSQDDPLFFPATNIPWLCGIMLHELWAFPERARIIILKITYHILDFDMVHGYEFLFGRDSWCLFVAYEGGYHPFTLPPLTKAFFDEHVHRGRGMVRLQYEAK